VSKDWMKGFVLRVAKRQNGKATEFDGSSLKNI